MVPCELFTSTWFCEGMGLCTHSEQNMRNWSTRFTIHYINYVLHSVQYQITTPATTVFFTKATSNLSYLLQYFLVKRPWTFFQSVVNFFDQQISVQRIGEVFFRIYQRIIRMLLIVISDPTKIILKNSCNMKYKLIRKINRRLDWHEKLFMRTVTATSWLSPTNKTRKSCVTAKGLAPAAYPVHSLLCPGGGGTLSWSWPGRGVPCPGPCWGEGVPICWSWLDYPPPPTEGTWDQKLGYPQRPGPSEQGIPLPPPVDWQTNWKYNLPSYFVCGR